MWTYAFCSFIYTAAALWDANLLKLFSECKFMKTIIVSVTSCRVQSIGMCVCVAGV